MQSEVIVADSAGTSSRVAFVLLAGAAGCYIGHGAFGIITKAAWVPYFAVGGVSEPMAWKLMPVIGTMDIVIGLVALIRPSRGLLIWAALWAIWTALLRPLAGEPVWEFFERAGNYGVPVALLAIAGLRGGVFARLSTESSELTTGNRHPLVLVLQFTTATLLAGHAGLGLFVHKAGLAHHYAALGLGQPDVLMPVIGAFEFLLAALVFLRPCLSLFIGICFWKIATESLFLVSGAPVWELIERSGSYAAPLALAFLFSPRHPVRTAETLSTT